MADLCRLDPERSYFTAGMDPQDAFFVAEGTVQIFVAKKNGDTVTSTPCLATVTADRYFPCLSLAEPDGSIWGFVVRPKAGDAVIERRASSATRFLKIRFLEENGLSGYEQESFEGCILNWVLGREMKNLLVIVNTEDGKRRYGDQGVRLIFGALESDGTPLASAATSSLNDSVLRYLCQQEKIEIATQERLQAVFGDNPTIPDIASLSGFLCREVLLEDDWYRNDCGYIVSRIDGKPIACRPRKAGRYTVYYADTQTEEPLTPDIAARIAHKAFSISRALPSKPMSQKDLRQFVYRNLRGRDIALILILGLTVTLIGLLLPTMNQLIYDQYIPLADVRPMVELCSVIVTFMIGNLLFTLVKNMMEFSVSTRIRLNLQNAVYYRVFHLPESFFRTIESGDLAQRIGAVGPMAEQYVNGVIVTGFSTAFSLLYLVRMISYSGKLTAVAFVMLLAYAAILFLISMRALPSQARIAELDGEAYGKLQQFLAGVDKIRMAGAEDRALFEYLIPFSEGQAQLIRKNRVSSLGTVMSGVISSIFSMVMYALIIHDKLELSVGSFIAFSTAFGLFSSAILTLIDAGISLYALTPIRQRVKPFLEIGTEDCDEGEGKRTPPDIEGRVVIDRVTFGYTRDMTVLKDLSLVVEPGEYIGIVGASGCGKSTLVKLLLGFEKPLSGRVCYDANDLAQVDKRALRRQLGVVLQNGDLIFGSIFDNITITSRNATLSDVYRVLDQVGLRQDVNEMPMGVHTMVSEGSGMLSGGQVQRILIARAIIGNPKVLIFDEATSALDNLTQKMVCDSLEAMCITRIVIAHRLSTIEKCSRIVFLKDGRIAELGSYAELMARRGDFYQMANRQLAEQEAAYE